MEQPAGVWTKALLQRPPVRLVTAPLANKRARIVWALMTRKEVCHAKRVRSPTDQQFAQQAFASLLVAPALDGDVETITLLQTAN
jgi:hypothetical protein